MRHTLFLVFIVISSALFSQDVDCENIPSGYTGKCTSFFHHGVIQFDGKYKDGKPHGKFRDYFKDGSLKEVKGYKGGELHGVRADYWKNGKIRRKGSFKNGSPSGKFEEYSKDGKLIRFAKIKNGSGVGTRYYESGQVRETGRLEDMDQVGTWKHYNGDGSLKKTVEYRDGMLVEEAEEREERLANEPAEIKKMTVTRDFTEEIPAEPAIEEEVEIVDFVNGSAEFPGGEQKLMEYISSRVRYPIAALEKGIEGKVFIEFQILVSGEVSEPRVIRGVDEDLDKEALRVVKSMPNWIPAINSNGNSVKSSMILPIAFHLGGKELNKTQKGSN